MFKITFLKFILLCAVAKASYDLPCARRYTEDSVVCVCNSSYCDTITWERPSPGQFIKYTTSRSGLRFNKRIGDIEILEPGYVLDDIFDMVLLLQTERTYQNIEGFGGAVTDSAAYNWKSLPWAVREQLVNTYFGENGIEYNMLRVPIGSSDFSISPWTYNSEPPFDVSLSNFTASHDDVEYKIPFITEILKAATDEVEVVSAVWSPPEWMLEVDYYNNIKSVRKEYYQAYADYHCKFAELYKQHGIKIWGVTPSNEPLTVVGGGVTNETTLWTVPDMAKLMADHLGPTLKKCSVEDIKLLAVDDQRNTLPTWLSELPLFSQEVMKYIDGVALHFYSDPNTSPALIPRAMSAFPDKFVLMTEGCVGSLGEDAHKLFPGSWDRAKSYIQDILENLNYNVVGWIDWNVCLNEQGGPTWTSNFVDAPVIVDALREEFYKQPIYYALGHFSKFLPRGSKRLRAVKTYPIPDPYLDIQDIEAMGQEYFDNVAFLTSRGTVVVIIHNDGLPRDVAIQLDNQVITVGLDEESITTIEFLSDLY